MPVQVDRLRTLISDHRITAVCNGKGGVGKTTTAATLAGLLAEAGYAVGLVDLDRQGNVGDDLGYNYSKRSDDGAAMLAAITSSTPDAAPLAGLLRNVRTYPAPDHTTVGGRLDVIPGGPQLTYLADLMSMQAMRGVDLVQRGVEVLALTAEAEQWDFVFIDCPPDTSSALTNLALRAARWIVSPTRIDESSIQALGFVAEAVQRANEQGADPEFLGVIVFALVHSARSQHRQTVAALEQMLYPEVVFEKTIRGADATAAVARRRGLLVFELAAAAAGDRTVPRAAQGLAADYGELARELLAKIRDRENGGGLEHDLPDSQHLHPTDADDKVGQS